MDWHAWTERLWQHTLRTLLPTWSPVREREYTRKALGDRMSDHRRSESHGLGKPWKVCPSCEGFGSLPLPNAPELKAIRAEVAMQYPAAVVPGADNVGPTSLRTVHEHRSVIVQDLQTGAMLCDSL